MIKFRNFENENDEFKIKIGISIISCARASYSDENKTRTHPKYEGKEEKPIATFHGPRSYDCFRKAFANLSFNLH